MKKIVDWLWVLTIVVVLNIICTTIVVQQLEKKVDRMTIQIFHLEHPAPTEEIEGHEVRPRTP